MFIHEMNVNSIYKYASYMWFLIETQGYLAPLFLLDKLANKSSKLSITNAFLNKKTYLYTNRFNRIHCFQDI